MFREIFVLVFLSVTTPTLAQTLQVVSSNTKLPVPVFGMPVVYDGEDSIYVLGGMDHNYEHQCDILKFSVTEETVEKVGSMEPVAFGSAVWAGNENILYFGGYDDDSDSGALRVWNYKPDGGREWTQVSELPGPCYSISSVWDHGEYSYVFGGHDDSVGAFNTISRYSSVTHTITHIGKLPTPRYGTSAVWDGATGDAYIFGGFYREWDIVKFNPIEGSKLLNVTLPVETGYTCAVWTGKEAYIIRGYSRAVTSYKDRNKIVRFNPSTNEVLDIPVKNFPTRLYGYGCAFVSKLNRIYIFGGVYGENTGDILYIDLGPIPSPSPTTFTLTSRTTTKNPGSLIELNNEAGRTRSPDLFTLLYVFLLLTCLNYFSGNCN